MGAVVGKFCMKLAIEKAKASGIGIVTAHSRFKEKIVLIHFDFGFFQTRIITVSRGSTLYKQLRRD